MSKVFITLMLQLVKMELISATLFAGWLVNVSPWDQ